LTVVAALTWAADPGPCRSDPAPGWLDPAPWRADLVAGGGGWGPCRRWGRCPYLLPLPSRPWLLQLSDEQAQGYACNYGQDGDSGVGGGCQAWCPVGQVKRP
jgi:hypothetical protein